MKKLLLLALVCCFGILQANAQYCTATHVNTCSVGAFITAMSATGSAFAPNLPTACAGSPIITLGTTGTDVLDLAPGSTSTLTVTTGTSALVISIWIDFNNDQVYDATEWFDLGRNVPANGTSTATIIVPSNAAGTVGCRIRTRLSGNPNAAGDACLSFASGTSYDLTASFTPLTACTSAPATPIINNTNIAICPGDSANLRYSNAPTESGLVALWESSTDNGATWAAAPGNNANYIYNVKGRNGAAQYRLSVSCTAAGGAPAISAGVPVTINDPSACYCTPSHGTNCSDNEIFTAVTAPGGFAPVMPTVCSATGGYTSAPFGRSADTLVLTQGSSTNIDFTTGTSPISGSFWIDFNRNGSFEASEWYDIGRTLAAGSTTPLTVLVPGSGPTGTTRARLRSRLTGNVNGAIDACNTTYGSGGSIDFNVIINAGTPCAGTPSAATITSDSTSLCATQQSVLRAANLSSGSGLAFEWQVSNDGGANWAAAQGTNTNPTYTFLGSYLTGAGSVQVRFASTCAGVTTNSNVVTIAAKSIAACICKPSHSGCTTTDLVTSMSVTGQAFSPTLPVDCSGNTNGFFTLAGNRASDTLVLPIGILTTLTVATSASSTGDVNGSVWIDYNNNGSLEASEWTDLGRAITAGSTVTADLTAPATYAGVVLGRVRTRAAASPNTATDACTAFGSGVGYDFPVLITGTVGLRQNLTLQNAIRVYPNPANKQVSVSMPTLTDGKVTFTITDLSGRVVSQLSPASVSNGTYVLPLDLAPGAYQLSTITTNGVAHTKLVVQQ
jgi:hypothetical protein